MEEKTIEAGDLILLTSQEGKEFLVTAEERVFGTHMGNLDLGSLLGMPWGSTVTTHKGKAFYLLKPSLHDLTRHIKRQTQIIFPKDLGFILMKLDVGPGKTIVECGTGSGSLTLALAWMVGSTGRVISYEKEEKFALLAQQNLKRVGLDQRVVFKIKNAREGFDEEGVDALFLDLRTPWEYLDQAHSALGGGKTLGILVPTTNQVTKALEKMEEGNFAYPEVCEILLRYYKPNAERLRPQDRMVAHTGFLIFARKVYKNPKSIINERREKP